MFSGHLRRVDTIGFRIEGDVELALCCAGLLGAVLLFMPVLAAMHFQTCAVHNEGGRYARNSGGLGQLQPLAAPRQSREI